jgi:ribosomal protein S17E
MGTTANRKVRMIVRELLNNYKDKFEGKTFDEVKQILDKIFEKEKKAGAFTKHMRNVIAGKIVRKLKRMKKAEIKKKIFKK